MIKYLNLLIVCFVLSAPLCAETAPTPKMLTSAFQELIDGVVPSDDASVKVDVLDYDVVEQQIVKWGVAFDVECSSAKAQGLIYARRPMFATFGSVARDLDKEVVTFLRVDLSLNKASLTTDQLLERVFKLLQVSSMAKSMSETTWSELAKHLQGELEGKFPYHHFSVKAVKKGHEEVFNGVSLVLDHTTEVILTYKGDNQVEVLLTLKDPSHSACLFSHKEQSVIQTVAALGRKDPAAMIDMEMILRSMRRFFLQYWKMMM